MTATDITSKPNPIKDNIVLFAALFANLGIAIAKFVAASISGSSAISAALTSRRPAASNCS